LGQYGFFFDQSRCVGCNACVVSCKQWHDLPPGPQKWMRVYQWEKGAFPKTRVHFLAISCYHCRKPVCLEACPNRAIYKEEKYGAVLIDPGKCKGSRQCWKACPYGAIVFASDRPGEPASKCGMCLDRLEQKKKPICVLSCSLRALEFGPMDEMISRFGHLQQLEEMPSPNITFPSVVFKAQEMKKAILPWDMKRAMELWKKRGPHNVGPSLYQSLEDFTRIPPGTIGRDRLVLKAENAAEFMYRTTDDD
jgi:anaerobic dimethyl sulfoxide reductase subunit B (iron-sulfur subunit)